MKRRTGFVSNSSSSSFIIGIGVIKDEERLRKELKLHGCTEYGYEIKEVKELSSSAGWDAGHYDNGVVVNTACVNDEPYITLMVEDTSAKVLLVNVGNNEGDSSFWNGDDMDYDQVDYDWFSENQQFLMDVLSDEAIISNSSGYEYGASRNG
jgi:hypothetical protein